MSYKFTNKETGEVKLGNPVEFNEGSEVFVLEDGENVTVINAEMDGSNLTNDKYTVESSYESVVSPVEATPVPEEVSETVSEPLTSDEVAGVQPEVVTE